MIEVNDLHFTYPGASGATVRGIDFAVTPGEVFGFLGPSGAGKSTTQKILTGLLRNFLGEARVLGRDLHRLRSDYYEEVGVSFELPNLYQKLTAVENLKYFASLFRGPTDDPRELLDRVLDGDRRRTRVARSAARTIVAALQPRSPPMTQPRSPLLC